MSRSEGNEHLPVEYLHKSLAGGFSPPFDRRAPSRREMLAMLSAAGIGLALGRPSALAQNLDKGPRFIDTHHHILPTGYMAEEGERITRESCAKFAHAEEQALARARDKGIKLIHFSPDDEKTMDTVFEAVSQDWAAGLDGRGKPGSEALRVWRSALQAALADH